MFKDDDEMDFEDFKRNLSKDPMGEYEQDELLESVRKNFPEKIRAQHDLLLNILGNSNSYTEIPSYRLLDFRRYSFAVLHFQRTHKMIKDGILVLIMTVASILGLQLLPVAPAVILLVILAVLEILIILNYRKSRCFKNFFGRERREIGTFTVFVLTFLACLIILPTIPCGKFDSAMFVSAVMYIDVIVAVQILITLGIVTSLVVGYAEGVFNEEAKARKAEELLSGKVVETCVYAKFKDGIIYLAKSMNIGGDPLSTYYQDFPSGNVSAIVKTTKDSVSWHTDVYNEAKKLCPIVNNDLLYVRFANQSYPEASIGKLVITGRPDYVNKVLQSLNLSTLT